MIRILKLYMVLFGILAITSSGWCEDKPAPSSFSLSLDDAIQTAFQNNKDLQIQAKEVDAARAFLLGTKSEFLPQLSVNAGYTHNDTILSLGSSPGAKKDPGIYTGYIDDHQAGLSIGQMVYNGGANIAQYKQAKVNLGIQGQTLRVRKQFVAFETRRLYYGLLLAQETKRITQDLVNLAQSHYEDTKKKFDAGTVSQFDVLQSKVQVSKITPELINAKNAVELIIAELKRLLGLKMQDVVLLRDKLAYSSLEVNEDRFLQLALLNNPEMAASSLGVDVRKLGIELARAGGYPQVNAGFGVNFRSNDMTDMFNSRHDNWNSGFSVTMPIFDGFSSKARVDEARARYAQAFLGKEDFKDQITVDVKQACLELNKAEALIRSQKDNIEEAKDALRIAQVRYDNGEGTNLDVLDAQVSLSQLEKNYSEGIYEYLIAEAYLKRILGEEIAAEK